ncbi:MAG: exonuclease subunit SbcD [Ilumatobacteraceae bacterium]
MRILHTGDWHLGKVLRGRNRHAEHEAVLSELVDVARAESVDLVLVTGDLFESAAPNAVSQELAWRTLLAFRSLGADVVVCAGNHDSAALFDAVAPVFAAAGVVIRGRLERPDAGGVVEVRRGGELARIAVLPWISPRQLLRADQLFEADASMLGQTYGSRVERVLGALTATATSSPEPAIELVAHAFVRGGKLGGGERDGQTVNDYGISATAFPARCLVRRPRPSPPHPADPRSLPDLVLRLSDRRRFRRGARRQGRRRRGRRARGAGPRSVRFRCARP